MTEIERDFDAMWDFHDPAATERTFRALLELRAGSADRLSLDELRTQLARTCSLQRRFDEAHAILDRVERELDDQSCMGRRLDATEARVRIRLLLERGRTLNSSGHPADAEPLFEQAWHLALETKHDALAVDAAHMRAIVCAAPERGGLAESVRWNERALECAERSMSPRARRWRASLHNNIGWSLHDAGRFAEALRSFERALELRIEDGDAREIRIARWCVARCLRSMGRVDEALRTQQALLREMHQAGHAQDGFVHEELGECLLALGRDTEARPHFAQAHAMLCDNAHVAPARLARLARLGDAASST